MNDKRNYVVDYFRKPSAQCAYDAGFIAGDGHINKHGYLMIKLKSSDKEFLSRMGKRMGCEIIHDYSEFDKRTESRTYSANLVIYNREITSDLKNIWNIPGGKKTIELEPPENLSIENAISYIKGLVDADGSYGVDKSSTRPKLNLLGTPKIIAWVRDFLEPLIDNRGSLSHRGVIDSVDYSGNAAIKIRQLFLERDTDCLERKIFNWESQQANLKILEPGHGGRVRYEKMRCRCNLCVEAQKIRTKIHHLKTYEPKKEKSKIDKPIKIANLEKQLGELVKTNEL